MQRIDLKRLIQLMNDQKNLNANLCLDEGCTVHADDQTALVKVLNYFINYLNQLGDQSIEISLDLLMNSSLLSMITYTKQNPLPQISPNVQTALDGYDAYYETDHSRGVYAQIKIHFKR